MSPLALKNLPSIEKGTWGSCALVGLADTLLRKKRGEEIDSHDTVIRLGELPLWGDYREFVGSKTDVTWVRRKSKMAPRHEIQKDRRSVKLYIGHNNGNMKMPALKIFGCIREGQENSTLFASFPHFIYSLFEVKNWNKNSHGRRTKPRQPSSGFKDAIALIFSGFCNRIDLYGFSFNCGGAYYKTKHLMQLSHNCELESWILHHLMKEHRELGTCVYI